MGDVFYQFTDFDLAVRIGFGQVLGGVGLGASACFVEEAGFFGADLEFGDGERVVRSFLQSRIYFLFTLIKLTELQGYGTAVMIKNFSGARGIQFAGINNIFVIDGFVGQTGVGFAITELVHQLKTCGLSASWAGVDVALHKGRNAGICRLNAHGV